LRQARALEAELRRIGLAVPVAAGFRHSHPFLHESLDRFASSGARRVLGFILSPQQSEASWDRYQKNVEEALTGLGTKAPAVRYVAGWHDHPLFIEALAELIEPLVGDPSNQEASLLIFTAHSIPQAMALKSSYAEQVHETASLVAQRLNHSRWSVAYQSRSGSPREPWLEPDIKEAIRKEAARRIVVAPVGFVCDHVEVLYDLDIDARKAAEGLGIKFLRSPCVNDHPKFIRMMADTIAEAAAGKR